MLTETDTTRATTGSLPQLAWQHWMQLHQIQLQTMLAWQRSLIEIQQDWFDCWSCRYAGAARIDD